jgi:hypothetical protein
MEDISGAGDREEKDILQANIIGRISSIFGIIINESRKPQV